MVIATTRTGCMAACCQCCRCMSITLAIASVVFFIASCFSVAGLSSSDLEAEIIVFARVMDLRSGMTICEMGAADGTLLSRLAPYVMPGGALYATAPLDREVRAMRQTLDKAGFGESLTTFKATDEDWAPGLPARSCDAIYSRMVYHMLSPGTAKRYARQWKASLAPQGKLFVTDHNPLDGGTTGPRRPIVAIVGGIGFMPVVPQETEKEEIEEAGGFVATLGPTHHPFYEGGYTGLCTSRRRQDDRGLDERAPAS